MLELSSFNVTPFIGIALTLILICHHLFIKSPRKVFLLDFSCYKPPLSHAVSKKETTNQVRKFGVYKEETLNFMEKAIERSGIGDSTYLPRAFLTDPPNVCFSEAMNEAEMVIFGAVDELLVKTKVNCEDIGILIVNCCIFNVTPSLSSMVVNRYKLKESVKSYNLSGMGCTAGLIAISLANQLLQVNHNCYALVVSTENLSQNCYFGNDLSKFLINCVFRVGGAAILLSNRPSDHNLSKYQLIHTVDTRVAFSDQSYQCLFQEEDEEGNIGVTVTKHLLVAAAEAIQSNIVTLSPLVLPLSEIIKYFINFVVRRCHLAEIEPYVPDFRKCFDHFLPHVGGKPVLDGVQRKLRLSDYDMEPSRMTLYRFGNTSSSTIWYELAYAEAKGKIKKGDRVWHIAFGSGFKCTSVVWHAIRTVGLEKANPWSDEVLKFPVEQNKVEPIPYFVSEQIATN